MTATPGPECTPPRPLRRDAELNRQRILRAAAEIFTEQGLQATLDDVARRAGVGVGTVYRRFPDKETLADALFTERLDALVALAEDALADPDEWGSLVSFLERARDAAGRRPRAAAAVHVRHLRASTGWARPGPGCSPSSPRWSPGPSRRRGTRGPAPHGCAADRVHARGGGRVRADHAPAGVAAVPGAPAGRPAPGAGRPNRAAQPALTPDEIEAAMRTTPLRRSG